MRRVYFTWFLRRALPVLAAEVAVFVLVVGGIRSYVSFGHVLNNAFLRITNHSLGGFGYYVYEATFQSELIVKLLLLAVVGVVLFTARDTMRVSRSFRRNFLGATSVS